uniref:alpha-amylase n=1 Tax=Electrophorus electricus TaxID=8005 RepID=A0A4W4GGU4_ELEEL
FVLFLVVSGFIFVYGMGLVNLHGSQPSGHDLQSYLYNMCRTCTRLCSDATRWLHLHIALWWQRYQPVSYKLCSRSGTEEELMAVIKRCSSTGVKLCTGGGEDNHSSCGTYFNADQKDFCPTHIETSAMKNVNPIRDCRLVGLLDLVLEKDHMRGKVAEYLNKLIDMGLAAFRLDASRHMWSGDLQAVSDKLHNLSSKWSHLFPGPSFPVLIDLGGEPVQVSKYFGLGSVTEFKSSAKLGIVVCRWDKEKLSYLKSWEEGWALMPTVKALVFVDNHGNQLGVTGTLGVLHKVMSSYRWICMTVWAPPSHSNGSTKPVAINPDTTWERQGANMVIFGHVLNGKPFTNWLQNSNNQISPLVVAVRGSLSSTTMTGEHGLNTSQGLSMTTGGRAHFHISGTDEDPFTAIHTDSKLY